MHEIQDAERSTSAHTIGRDPVHQHSEASRVSRAKARGEQGPDDPREGVARASKTLKNIRGAWVQDQKVDVEKGKITAYRVTLKVTFILED